METYVKKAIKASIKGGYEILGLYDSEHPCIEDTAMIFLDPLFWQCFIGKDKITEVSHGNWDEMNTMTYENVPTWRHHWHNFIDHLADGGTAESFFDTI